MRIAFIGMGEAGSAIVSGWSKDQAANIRSYDIKIEDPATAGEIRTRCAALGIIACENLDGALEGADIVFCTVTADQAVAAARAAAPLIGQGAIWCDLNSCAPSSKRTAADLIEAGGGRYVDVAVMSPVHPGLNMTPMLVAGPHASDVLPVLLALPMAAKLVEGDVGKASSIKMLRSVMVKGLEALTAECALAAVAAGVEAEVFASLDKSHPGRDWDGQAAYNLERSLVHGLRRAAEMEEVAKTLTDLGLPDDMARATVLWQRRIGQTGLPAPKDPAQATARQIAETLLPVIRDET